MNKNIKGLLLNVQKPGRYVGGELNSIIKNKNDIDIRFAFCFPDIYEIGMSHLGMKILYSQFNESPFIWCERVFAPWIDMEEEMRKNSVPLFAIESGDPITSFDFIGFTLQYELSFTNILNMLDLAKIPKRSSERTQLNQIVVAGGPCACNPEPLADFIDIFFIGEGEKVDMEVMEIYRDFKKYGKSKSEFLNRVSEIEGIYVPSLYNVSYNDDGTINSFIPKGNAPCKIKKRIMTDMDNSYYPDKLIVPMIEIVHDRATAEIFRGCIRGCRFCQAGFIYRPKREKSIKTINDQCKSICKSSGYNEISLSSLSSSDYSKINELIRTLLLWTEDKKISISLPSLRVDGFSEELMSKLKTVRRSGLTFAPEAGTQRLRNVINKNVTEEEIMNTVFTAFNGGWTKIKLYFMIGLPTETLEDVEAIPSLGQTVVDSYYSIKTEHRIKGPSVTISASSFVPKPFTPFQWESQNSIDEIRKKQNLIKNSIKTRKINFNYHDCNTSFLEGVFARGDRKLCKILEKAQESGCRFDGWSECFNLEKWLNIFSECNLDPYFYTDRKRSFDEILPWDHLDYGIKKDFLIDECNRSRKNITTPNCEKKCSACGANSFESGVCYERH